MYYSTYDNCYLKKLSIPIYPAFAKKKVNKNGNLASGDVSLFLKYELISIDSKKIIGFGFRKGGLRFTDLSL